MQRKRESWSDEKQVSEHRRHGFIYLNLTWQRQPAPGVG